MLIRVSVSSHEGCTGARQSSEQARCAHAALKLTITAYKLAVRAWRGYSHP